VYHPPKVQFGGGIEGADDERERGSNAGGEAGSKVCQGLGPNVRQEDGRPRADGKTDEAEIVRLVEMKRVRENRWVAENGREE